MKSFSLKPTNVTRKWYLIDASGVSLGRLSTQVANLLIGKSKPNYTPHVDNGDFVVVINASSIKITGKKLLQKTYYRHSGYPGNLREKTLAELFESNPGQVIEKSVKGMLPVNKLRPGRIARLKIYSDSEHSHSAQKPEVFTIKENK